MKYIVKQSQSQSDVVSLEESGVKKMTILWTIIVHFLLIVTFLLDLLGDADYKLTIAPVLEEIGIIHSFNICRY